MDSSPAPNATLIEAPTEISLTFSEPIRPQGIEVALVDEQQQLPVELSTPFVINGRSLNYAVIGELQPGEYTIAYRVVPASGGEPIRGTLLFQFEPPRPRLTVNVPVDGQTFDSGTIPIEVETAFFDLSALNQSLRITVNSEVVGSSSVPQYVIEDLDPGVHEIRIGLDVDGELVPESEKIVTIAIRRSDETPQASSSSPSVLGLVLGGLASAVVLALGMYLGRSPATS